MAMNVSVLSEQFKTTVPKGIREKANMDSGTFLQWENNDDGTVTVRPVLPVGIIKSD